MCKGRYPPYRLLVHISIQFLVILWPGMVQLGAETDRRLINLFMKVRWLRLGTFSIYVTDTAKGNFHINFHKLSCKKSAVVVYQLGVEHKLHYSYIKLSYMHKSRL